MKPESTAVVIPVGPGRRENLAHVLEALENQEARPGAIVIVYDGPDAWPAVYPGGVIRKFHLEGKEKHVPGLQQPRNVGVMAIANSLLGEIDISHIWFLDSDVVPDSRALAEYIEGSNSQPEDRILVGPYDWLGAGDMPPKPELRNDPRWPSFDRHGPEEVVYSDLSAGLACFSGNLVWPIDKFLHIGGFWNELHHGRCEDGELGLRAVAMGVPISFVPRARAWHIHHERNNAWIFEANRRDVPMLNKRHPWVQNHGLCVVDEDGKRFNVKCPECGADMNAAEWWDHSANSCELVTL